MNKRSQMLLVHPSEVLKPEWVLKKQSIRSEMLVVEYHRQPPDEIEIPGFTHHALVSQLSPGTRQITRINQREYDGAMQPGDLFLFPAKTPGLTAWETRDECLMFFVDPCFLHRVATDTNCLNPDKIEILPILKTHDPQIQSIALSFLREINSNNLGGKLYTESLANLFLIHLLRHYCVFKPKLKQYQGGLSENRLRTAIDYIQAHLDEKLTLDAIARQLNISQYHFCDLFKQSMGIPPYKYVIQQRVARAKQLLRKEPEKAIVDIALECGFANQTHFHKHFRQHTGMTPKAYRQS